MPSGVFKRIKGVNVNNEGHPWRAMILADVIEAGRIKKDRRAKWLIKSGRWKKK